MSTSSSTAQADADAWLSDTPAPAVGMVDATPAVPHHGERHAVVCGSAGGVGASVVSALLAEYRSNELGSRSWWVDMAPSDSDIVDRLDATVRGRDDRIHVSAANTLLWEPPGGLSLVGAVTEVAEEGAVATIDAGATALASTPDLHLLPDATPVLVVAPRPDLLNRCRAVLRVWDQADILSRTVLVIVSQVPTLNASALSDQMRSAVVGKVADVVALDYDPVLGSGGGLSGEAQRNLTDQTWCAVGDLAYATGTTMAARRVAQ